MVTGMLLAGGVGKRVGRDKPKQFIRINDKPIIYYPLKNMEDHFLIDTIVIVCVEDYIDELWSIVKENGFTKVKWIVAGGATSQESTRNGLFHLEGLIHTDDIILVHMTSYPLASKELITNCIDSAIRNGNGVTARGIPYSVYETIDKKTTTKWIDRNTLMLSTIPLAFRYGECLDVYKKAYSENKGIEGDVYATTLYCDYGKKLFFTPDSPLNIKITSAEDITLMEAYLKLIK